MHLAKSALLALFLAAAAGAAYANDFTGSWEYAGRAQSGLWLKTLQTGNKVRFQLELQRGAPSYNSGWLEGEAGLAGAVAVFRSKEDGECEISFTFAARSVQIKETPQKDDCGFGFNVHADGKLRRKSAKPPKFTNGDPRAGAK